MLVGMGCSVPGIMASRTIEQERDRRMTVMTTAFIPCGAKMPFVGMIAGALFGGSAWIATSAYFVGVAAVVISGIILKKTKPFAGKPAPFVMELPSYHAPVPSNIARTVWDRGWSFVQRAGTVILAASIIIWILNSLSFTGGLHYIGDTDDASILSVIGKYIAVLFVPLGFGNWQAAVATVMGLIAKEEVLGTFGTLSQMLPEGVDLLSDIEGGTFANAIVIGREFFGGSKLAAYSFMIFNLLCAPCFAARGAIRREMNSGKWTFAAIGYMCLFAYAVSLMIYQFGRLAQGIFTPWTAVAIVVLLVMLYMLFRRNKNALTD
jgi:ferrous iron transport protein B